MNTRNIERILRFVLPFSNEIANALTIYHEGPFKRLYVACPDSWLEFRNKSAVDMLALSGIVWNVSDVSSSSGLYKGLLQGIMLIVVAFLIPNLTMEPIINYVCSGDTDNVYDDDTDSATNKCSNSTKLIVGFSYIGFLFILEYVMSNIIRKIKI